MIGYAREDQGSAAILAGEDYGGSAPCYRGWSDCDETASQGWGLLGI